MVFLITGERNDTCIQFGGFRLNIWRVYVHFQHAAPVITHGVINLINIIIKQQGHSCRLTDRQTHGQSMKEERKIGGLIDVWIDR